MQLIVPPLQLTYGWSAVALLLLAVSARSADVEARLSSRSAYVGIPILLQVTVNDAGEHDPPVAPTLDGVKITPLGQTNQSSQTTIINGKRTDRTSVSYGFRLTPLREGDFLVPPFSVEIDGRHYETRAIRFSAGKSDSAGLLDAEINGARDKIYVGQALQLTLSIWIKPFYDSEYRLELDEEEMWNLVTDDPEYWGFFADRIAEMKAGRQRPRGEKVTHEFEGREESCYRYQIQTTIYPKRPGKLDGSETRVLMEYPEALGRQRDVFGLVDSLTITQTRPVVATAKMQSIQIVPIPEDGRPGDYRGAVGKYSIAVDASPHKVYEGDPLTLRITVRGDGPMDLLQAPPLEANVDLTSQFFVEDDQLAGVSRGDTKQFTTSIRPRNAAVQAVPAVSFSYFDPDQGKYATVTSQPIPIEVLPSERLDLANVESHLAAGRRSEKAMQQSSGEVPPYAPETIGTSTRSPVIPWLLWVSLLGSPLLFVIVLGRIQFGAHRSRLFGWGKYPNAWAASEHRLKNSAKGSDLATAMLDDIRLRFTDLPSAITRSEALEAMRRHHVGSALIDEFDRVLGIAAAADYALAGEAEIAATRQSAIKVLKQIHFGRNRADG